MAEEIGHLISHNVDLSKVITFALCTLCNNGALQSSYYHTSKMAVDARVKLYTTKNITKAYLL